MLPNLAAYTLQNDEKERLRTAAWYRCSQHGSSIEFTFTSRFGAAGGLNTQLEFYRTGQGGVNSKPQHSLSSLRQVHCRWAFPASKYMCRVHLCVCCCLEWYVPHSRSPPGRVAGEQGQR